MTVTPTVNLMIKILSILTMEGPHQNQRQVSYQAKIWGKLTNVLRFTAKDLPDLDLKMEF